MKQHLEHAQQRMKHQADKRRSEREFAVGDWVYMKLVPYRQSTVAIRKSVKLAPRYFGPFQVLQRIGAVAYKLDLPNGARIHPVVHVSRLKKKVGTKAHIQATLPSVNEDGQVQLEPVAILDRRMTKKNNRSITQVLIQWSNSFPEDATWENWYDILQRFPTLQP